MSFSMTKAWLAVFPIVAYFTLETAYATSGFAVSNERYAEHTPYCEYTPNSLGSYNTAYRCTQDAAHQDLGIRSERGDHILGHLYSGVASGAVFLSPTTYYETFAIATEHAAKIDTTLPMTNITTTLQQHDFERFQAVGDYEEHFRTYFVNLSQGVVFIATIIATQVLTRASCTSMGDAVQGRVTKVEFVAFWCTALNGCVALLLNSMSTYDLDVNTMAVMMMLVVAIILVQFGCLLKVCHDILHNKHALLLKRGPRASAVAPQPTKPAAANLQVGLRSATTTAPVSLNSLLSVIESLSATVKEQAAFLEEQKTNAESQLRKADRQHLGLSARLEEQTKARLEEQKAFEDRLGEMNACVQKLEARCRTCGMGNPTAEEVPALLKKQSTAKRVLLNANDDKIFSTWGKLESLKLKRPEQSTPSPNTQAAVDSQEPTELRH
jgi:hypothetical protein